MAPTTTKCCFVTIGATASFDALIKACFHPSFLSSLQTRCYTDLVIQYGKSGRDLFDKLLAETEGNHPPGLSIQGFDFKAHGLSNDMNFARGIPRNPNGVHNQMNAAKGVPLNREGVVISHAGSGTILDALRLDVALIVVPNPELSENHQLELAEELERQGYVIHSDTSHLPEAIGQAEELKYRRKRFPPVNAGEPPRGYEQLSRVIWDEVGFLD